MKKYRELTAAVIGYIIGAVTVFILFGINAASDNTKSNTEIGSDDSGFLVEKAQGSDVKGVQLKKTEEGLFIEVEGEEKIVSVSVDADKASAPGYHTDLPYYELSPTADSLFICAVMERGSDECTGMTYSVENHSLVIENYYNLNSIEHSW